MVYAAATAWHHYRWRSGWTGKSVSPIPEKYTILPANSAVEVDDYSEKNKLAVLTRRDRLAGFHRIPGKKTIDEDYNFKKLEAETLQVRDLIALIQQGAQHHVSGLGTRIRLLIAIGTPMPLLQLCAALLSEPLIVFTVPRPFRPPIFDVLPMDKNSLGISCNISALANERLTNPIDLDVWLDTNAGNFALNKFTHKYLLSTIRNKIASHVDPHLHPYIEMLELCAWSCREEIQIN